MNMGRTTRIVLNKVATGRGNPLYQYDYGQMIQFIGVSLPGTYEVHFSNTDVAGAAKIQLGSANGVMIPDELLLSGDPIYIWVFLHEGDSDGETEYKAFIPVIRRPITDETPIDPVQQDVITQAIAALNSAVESTSADADAAMASQMMAAQSEQNAAGSAALALASEHAAAASEANARQSEQNASASEGAAGRSQVAAATSASEALESQEAAAVSAAEALESREAAASSAAAALASQQAAKASEDNAALSESNANASETTAANMAEMAITKAAEAGASATAAEASRQAIEDLSVLANTLSPGQRATVTKQVDSGGNVTLVFGIPEGIPGKALYS
jgi:hypothetical protein